MFWHDERATHPVGIYLGDTCGKDLRERLAGRCWMAWPNPQLVLLLSFPLMLLPRGMSISGASHRQTPPTKSRKQPRQSVVSVLDFRLGLVVAGQAKTDVSCQRLYHFAESRGRSCVVLVWIRCGCLWNPWWRRARIPGLAKRKDDNN